MTDRGSHAGLIYEPAHENYTRGIHMQQMEIPGVHEYSEASVFFEMSEKYSTAVHRGRRA